MQGSEEYSVQLKWRDGVLALWCDCPYFIDNAIPSGSSSVILVVKTSATSYGGGSIFIQDGGNVTLSGFAPAPLPATANMGLVLLLGLGGIGGIRKMRAIRAVA